MLFIETLKKEVKPGAGLKKPELAALCMEHDIEVDKKDTMAIMTEKLLEK